jgi:hypothetical protein
MFKTKIILGTTNSFDSFKVNLPSFVVPKTLRGIFTVIGKKNIYKNHFNDQKIINFFKGDPMGPALDNLDNLVQLPTGCGEQNMIRFAPLVSVTKYLKDTLQLNFKVSALAQEYLKIG